MAALTRRKPALGIDRNKSRGSGRTDARDDVAATDESDARSGAGAPLDGFAIEATAIGWQSLVPGVTPITGTERLQWRADAPLLPGRPQRPCDLGLFDEGARNQLDLFLHTGARP